MKKRKKTKKYGLTLDLIERSLWNLKDCEDRLQRAEILLVNKRKKRSQRNDVVESTITNYVIESLARHFEQLDNFPVAGEIRKFKKKS